MLLAARLGFSPWSRAANRRQSVVLILTTKRLALDRRVPLRASMNRLIRIQNRGHLETKTAHNRGEVRTVTVGYRKLHASHVHRQLAGAIELKHRSGAMKDQHETTRSVTWQRDFMCHPLRNDDESWWRSLRPAPRRGCSPLRTFGRLRPIDHLVVVILDLLETRQALALRVGQELLELTDGVLDDFVDRHYRALAASNDEEPVLAAGSSVVVATVQTNEDEFRTTTSLRL